MFSVAAVADCLSLSLSSTNALLAQDQSTMQCLCKGQPAQLQTQARPSTALCIRTASLAHHKPHGYHQPPQTVCQQQQLPLMQSQQQWQQQAQRSSCVARAGPPEHVEAGSKKRLAVFVSGGGSNFKAIHAACQKGVINAEVAAVVSDVPTCGGVAYAKEQGIATLTYPTSKKGLFVGLSKEELVQQLTEQHQVDFVLLAGYLKLIPDELVRCFKRKMLNIHPGLLPSFGGKGYYGERVHQAVLASGARFSGPTVHFVDAEYDTGPILAQRVVPVYPTDSPKQLAARVLEQEHQVYPYAVSALVDGRITFREDGIPIIWEAK